MTTANTLRKFTHFLFAIILCATFGLSAQAQEKGKKMNKGQKISKEKRMNRPLKKGEMTFEACCEKNNNNTKKCQKMKTVRNARKKEGKKFVKKVCPVKTAEMELEE